MALSPFADGGRRLDMTRPEFIALIGQDVVVDYPFFEDVQQWSMKNFSYNSDTDTIIHNRLPMNVEVMIPHISNPHMGEATHG